MSVTSGSGKGKRSRHLSRGENGSMMDIEGDALGLDDEEDDDSDSDSDGDDHLPVTGFAVASNRRQGDFHQLFAVVDEGDYLIEGEFRLVT